MRAAPATPSPHFVTPHLLDGLTLGKIVLIREKLLKAQAAGAKVFRFESGDPNFDCSPHVLEALGAAARAGKTHYIPNAGIPELRAALFEKATRGNRIPLRSPEDVFVTNGAMHALFAVFQCLLDPGDEVLVPDPMWTEVVENIKLARGVPVGVPLTPEREFQYTAEEVGKRVTPRTKVLFLNTPHNPTGAVIPESELLKLLELARAHDLFVVSDEAYEDVVFPPFKHVSIASLEPLRADKIVSVFSFSKSHAMSGLRVGYLTTANDVLHERLQKVLRCSINGVNSLGQWAALAALSGSAGFQARMREEYLERREILVAALESIPGFTPFRSRGSFFVWAKVDPALLSRHGLPDVDALSSALAAAGIGSSPGDAFGHSCEDYIRFSFSCATPMVREGAAALKAFFKIS